MGYTVSYPVLFESGGDTTRDAFNKHIQEISTIYGILNELADADISDEELTELQTGKISTSRLEGEIDGSQITGSIDTATIPADNVMDLHRRLTELLPEASGQGIVEHQAENPGYVKFGNGIVVQWGNTGEVFGESVEALVSYPLTFSTILTVQVTCVETNAENTRGVQVMEYGEAGIRCRISGTSPTARVEYLAIGYGGI